MRKNVSLGLALLMVFLCAWAVPAGLAEEGSPLEAADAILGGLVTGDYASVAAAVDGSAQAELSEEALRTGWEQVMAIYGGFVEALDAVQTEQDGYVIVQRTLVFEGGRLAVVLVMTPGGKLAGVSAMPDATPATETPPLPLPEGAAEESVSLRPGQPDETAGLLVLPGSEGPFPAVVLIHGSGASDMDETIFGVKPFRDLAVGLAQQGVASLRYDKYTYAHPELMTGASIRQEYELDVEAAVALLSQDSRISDIYLLGHSEGGMLLPRLLDLCGGAAAGGIILAGSPRALWEIQQMQNEDIIAMLPEEQRAPSQAIVDAEVEKALRLAEMTEAELAQEVIFGVPASYHKDIAGVDPIAKAKELALPLLILQGGKDFQVNPDVDFAAWKSGLSGEVYVSFILYPTLTHLFTALAGDSTGTVADYQQGGLMAEEVARDIAAWIIDGR